MDFGILNGIQNSLKNPFFDWIMPIFSFLGENGAIWLIIGIVMVCFKKTRSYGVLLLISMAFVFVTGELVIKNLVGRVRPCNVPGTEINMLVPKPRGFSFPSGHSSSSFAAAVIIFIWDRRFGIAALCLAFCIAFSRMYLYVHFPSDVLVGSLWGIAGALIVYLIYKKFYLKERDLREKK